MITGLMLHFSKGVCILTISHLDSVKYIVLVFTFYIERRASLGGMLHRKRDTKTPDYGCLYK